MQLLIARAAFEVGSGLIIRHGRHIGACPGRQIMKDSFKEEPVDIDGAAAHGNLQ